MTQLASQGALEIVKQLLHVAAQGATGEKKKAFTAGLRRGAKLLSVIATDPADCALLLKGVEREVTRVARVLETSPMVDFPPKAGDSDPA